jgi:predicted kinase
MWKICRQLLANEIDVIVDLGFMKREHRARFRAMAAEAGLAIKVHYVTADAEVRRERVRSRNRGESATFTIEVSDFMFDWAEKWFEAPEGEELSGAVVVINDDPPPQ